MRTWVTTSQNKAGEDEGGQRFHFFTSFCLVFLKGGSPPTGKKTRFLTMRFVLGGSPPASKKTTCPETDLCSFRAISFICSNKSIGRLIVICFFSYFSGDVLIIFGCKNYILSLLNQISGNDFSHGHIQLFCSLLKFSEEDDWYPY